MADAYRTLWLSVQPRFANAILDGTKTVELRRTRIDVSHGDLVLVYESSPTMQVSGIFWVDFIIDGPLSAIWALTRTRCGVTREEFSDYFAGAETAVAIYVDSAQRLRRPVPLARLREMWPGFHVPQSYRYLSPLDAREILKCSNTRLTDRRQLVIPAISRIARSSTPKPRRAK
jgi:predicted transcriptional regulator